MQHFQFKNAGVQNRTILWNPKYTRPGDKKKVVVRMRKTTATTTTLTKKPTTIIRPGDEKKVVVGMKNGPLQLLDEELKPFQVFPT